MATMDLTTEFKLTGVRKHNLQKTFEQIESHSSSVLFLALQWKDLQEHFDSIEKFFSDRQEELSSVGTLLKKRFEELELREKRFETAQETLSQRFKDLECRERNFEENGKRVFEESAKELESMLVSVEKRWEEIGKVQKVVQGGLKDLDLKEKRSGSLQRSIERESKELQSIRNSLNERFREIDLREREIRLAEERAKAIELKEERFESLQKSVEDKLEELELIQKSNREKSSELELKESNLNLVQKSVEELLKETELREKRVGEYSKELELKESELNRLQKSVEEGLIEIDLRKKRVEECSKGLALREKRFEECAKEHELKDKRFEERAKELELKEKRFEECAKAFGLKERRFEEQFKEIEVKVKKLMEWSRGIELKGEECHQIVELNENKFEECLENMESKDMGYAGIVNNEVKSNASENVVENNAIDTFAFENLRLCRTWDGKRLRSFLSEHVEEHDLMRDEVWAVLKESSDSAKLVLDAMQGFYPLDTENGNPGTELGVIRKSCILLLEQLMRVSPEIQPHVREGAIKHSFEWITKMRPGGDYYIEVLGFLLLLSAYGLASTFDDDELVSQLLVIARDRLAPELCRILGLTEKISEFIRNLLTNGKHLDAARLVYAFKLVDKFPSVPLLKCYVKVSKEVTKKNCLSPAAKIEVINKRIADVRAVVGCIEDHKLESKFFAMSLKNLISQLIKQKISIIMTLQVPARKLQSQQYCGKSVRPTPKVHQQQQRRNKQARIALSAAVPHRQEKGLYTGQDELGLFESVYRHKNGPHLCQILGLAEKIPELVQNLIEMNKWLDAIPCIFEFKLFDKFPPVPLLKNYLSHFKMIAENLCEKGNNSPQAQKKAIEKELGALRCVLKRIADYGLEIEYPPNSLEERILQLEKQKTDILKVLDFKEGSGLVTAPTSSPAYEPQPEQQIGKKLLITSASPESAPDHSISSASTMKADALKVLSLEGGSSVTALTPAPVSEPQLYRQSGKKRPRTSASQESGQDHSVNGASSSLSEQKPPPQEASSHNNNRDVLYYPIRNPIYGQTCSYPETTVSYCPQDELESEYPPNGLEGDIGQLENQKTDKVLNYKEGGSFLPAPTTASEPQMQQQSKKRRRRTFASAESVP